MIKNSKKGSFDLLSQKKGLKGHNFVRWIHCFSNVWVLLPLDISIYDLSLKPDNGLNKSHFNKKNLAAKLWTLI